MYVCTYLIVFADSLLITKELLPEMSRNFRCGKLVSCWKKFYQLSFKKISQSLGGNLVMDSSVTSREAVIKHVMSF